MQKMTHRLTEDLRRISNENHGECTNCDYRFVKGDTCHLGYDKTEKPKYVCDSCSSVLEETAERRNFTPRPYETPKNNSCLWRYMDFTKYVSLLSTSSLYFSRADTFDDPFEGAKGIISNKAKWDEHFLGAFKSILKSPPGCVEWDQSEEHVNKEAHRLLKELEESGQADRENAYISCWHENEHESEAMWRLYSNFIDNAVAIRSTYSSLYNALGRNPSISIGRVRYLDYDKHYANPGDSFWRKRKSFEHEREVRAIVHDFNTEDFGIPMECDLDVLIEDVVVSPTAPSWFVNVLNDINRKYEINIKVRQSNLNAVPFF
ncbi:MAG: hypothetical protein JKX76_04345 [Colwellia sp.]|nr:hypothetical protein [Colwellia sp.]